MRKLPLVIVEWDDTSTHTKWCKEDREHTEDASHCVSVGWRLSSSREHIVLTPMRDKEGWCSDRQIIPRGCITSITKIKGQ